MVSRNAGWNMCDLKGKWFPLILKGQTRQQLFLTYERANWLIFHDAYPQLLLYDYSTKIDRPMFHLLRYFHVSPLMITEWQDYWERKDKRRLMNALIINEQNVIQRPVIEHPLYHEKVFHSLIFAIQDFLHFSAVVFPTRQGELFGASVYGFQSVDNRIDLGKRLADILFHPSVYKEVLDFAKCTQHTGSRDDYERYMCFSRSSTPKLRSAYPVVRHHIHMKNEWTTYTKIRKKWFKKRVKHRHPWKMTEWYKDKQRQLQLVIKLYTFLPFKRRL